MHFMMPSCIVCGRTKNRNSKSDNISFHRFPVKDYIRKKWDNFLIENCLNPKNVTKYSLVCSSHFEESCFVMKQSRKLLQKHVFPSIVVSRIKSAKQLYIESKKTVPVSQEVEKEDNPTNILHFESTLVKISRTIVVELDMFSLEEPPVSINNGSCISKSDIQNKNISSPIQNIEIDEVLSMNEPSSYNSDKLDENKMNKSESTLLAASEVTMEDTTCIFLKRGIQQLSQQMFIKNIKLKSLQQTIRRKNKKIANMQAIINDLKNRNLIDVDASVTFLESFGKNEDLITN